MSLVKIYQKPEKSRIKKYLLLFIFFALIAAPFVGWNYFKSQIFLYLNKDSYTNIEKQYVILANHIKTSKNSVTNEEEIEIFLDRLQTSIKKNPTDGRFYYIKGDIYWELIKKKFINPESIHMIILRSYHRSLTNKDHSDSLITTAIINFRKATHLNLPHKAKKELYEKLAFLYFLSGPEFTDIGRKYVKSLPNESIIKNLYKILNFSSSIQWDVIQSEFTSEYTEIWKAVYYLNRKSYPFAFNVLKNVIASTENDLIRNESHYLMFRLMKQNNNHNVMLYHLQKINLKSYLNYYPHFLSEYATTMRFYGYYNKASSAIAKFEKKQQE